MGDVLRIQPLGEFDPIGLAHTISRIGIPVIADVTFQWHDGILQNAWESWLERLFLPILAPHFSTVHRLGGEGKAQEIRSLDLELSKHLSAHETERSCLAGARFLDTKSGIRAERVWTRFVESVRCDQCPGHLPTFFALQTALFQLPLASALATYAWFELESGSSVHRFRNPDERQAKIVPIFSNTLPTIRLALEGNRTDSAQDTPFLRSI